MGYRCQHFSVYELVPPEVYQARGEKAWELLDPAALVTLDALRTHFGPVTVNDWRWGGSYKESGFRTAQSETGAVYSQHRYGRAFDCKFAETTPQAVYEYVLAHPEQFPHLTTLEDIRYTPTWLHIDVRNNERTGIRTIIP